MNAEPLLYISNLKKSVRFYTDTLGFKLGMLYPDEESATYASVFIGGSKLMLVLAREQNKKFYPKGLGGSGFQLFIQVDDVDKVYQKLKDKVDIVNEIESKSWGDREFTLRDPDGYLISFYTGTE